MRRSHRARRRRASFHLALCAAVLAAATPALAQRRSPVASGEPPGTAREDSDRQVRPGAMLARADSAWGAGDRERARAWYAAAFAADSTLSRAAFRLAQFESSPARALALYRHYQRLEPRDPWGFMAEGDVLGRMGRYDDAREAYTRAAALAPGERDVAVGRARLHLRAGRPDAAAMELARWTERHPGDAEAWDLLGRSRLRAGRPRAASAAFDRAGQAGGVARVEGRLALANALAAPAVEPYVGYQRDSDGNRTGRVGGAADAMVADGVRLGAGGERISVGDGLVHSDGLAAYGRLAARPAPGVRLDVQGGATRYVSPFATGGDWTTPDGEARLRVRSPRGRASLDLRAQRLPLGTAPVLVENHVVRSEVRATAELPATVLRLRGSARAGRVEALGEAANRRVGAEGAVVVPVGDRLQLSGQYRWMGFQRASLAGYFAPRSAETLEGGVYLEAGEDGPVTLAADVGAGAQRVAEQGADVGRWTRALRAWAYGSIAMGPGRAVYTELEAYDAPFAPDGVATSGTWRFVSLSLGVRWALR